VESCIGLAGDTCRRNGPPLSFDCAGGGYPSSAIDRIHDTSVTTSTSGSFVQHPGARECSKSIQSAQYQPSGGWLRSGRGMVLCEDNDVAGGIGIADFRAAIKRRTPRHDEPLAPKLAFDV
jgi:hypothetical protein